MKLKKTIIIIVILLSFENFFAQDENLNSSKHQFAKEVFEKKYSKQNFEKFKGEIILLNNNCIQFDEKTIFFENINEFRSIFTNGILYPNIITGDTISRINYFAEAKALNPNSKFKRFIFWLHRVGMANPTECYFELENEEANEKTSLSEFIRNSKLTFYYRGTLII